jgi:hypothetical protein
VLENIQAVSLVGVACLGIWAAISAFRVLRELLGFGPASGAGSASHGAGGDDYWDGYTAADDARDRAAAGAGLEAVYERASAMASAGEGQSQDFRHNTVTAAYDAGYMGKHLGDSVDPATHAAWSEGRSHREEDMKAWDEGRT